MRKTRRSILLAALAVISMPVVGALSGASARALTNEQKEAVASISDFLNSFRTLEGEFTQVSPRGRVSTGRFYISKPGRMRFEYAPPVPIVIVSDGTWVAIRNNRRDTVDYYPLSRTPLRMVLAPRVDLARDAIIHDVERRNGLLIVTLRDRDRMVPGKLILVFDEGRRTLQQWIIVDAPAVDHRRWPGAPHHRLARQNGHERKGQRQAVPCGPAGPGTEGAQEDLSGKLFHVARPGQGRKVRKKTNFRSTR